MEFVAVGRILAPWGVRGEVKVEVLTDFPQRLAAGRHVYMDGNPFPIERSRRHGKQVVVKLAAIDSRTAAEHLRGRLLELPLSELGPLPEGDYYRFQIVGLRVVTTGGEDLGTVSDILPTGSNDVYVVQGKWGEVLIPAIEDVVKSIDLEEACMVIEVIEGLLTSAPPQAAHRREGRGR